MEHSAVAVGDDFSIARHIAAGDRVAFEALMRRHNRRLYRLARATLRDGAEAEDALQEAYLQAFRSISQFRGDAALSTWLSRLVLNECFGRIRRRDRRENVIPMVSANNEAARSCVDESEAPDAALARAQVRTVLERRVDELPDSFRAVFVMRSVEDLSVAETSELLGIPEETVRSRHFRAKSLLRAALEAELGRAEGTLFEFGGEHCDRVVAGVLGRLG
ncbi:MAG: RNA polymerase sigma factor [Proteobacteria bacterium]|nr:RNA polymerase sigma factor [Pseudomonadota bacterium]